MKYLIGERFLVERNGAGPWVVKDSKGDFYKIFRVKQINLWSLKVYKGDDVYWILDDVLLLSSDDGVGNVVIKGSEIVSYSVLEKGEFYINHYGQEFKGRIDVGKRREILIDGGNLEVRKTENDFLKFEYKFLGDKVTPVIEVRGKTSISVCFPEFNKAYNRILCVWNCWGCLNVGVLKKNNNKNEGLALYVLLKNGEEFLVYESPNLYPTLYKLPTLTLHSMGNIMVVNFHGKENEIVNGLRRIPGFDYLYVKQDFNEGVYISFNMKSWEKLEKVDSLMFKGGEKKIGRGTLYFQQYFPEDALEKFAKRQPAHQERLPLPAF